MKNLQFNTKESIDNIWESLQRAESGKALYLSFFLSGTTTLKEKHKHFIDHIKVAICKNFYHGPDILVGHSCNAILEKFGQDKPRDEGEKIFLYNMIDRYKPGSSIDVIIKNNLKLRKGEISELQITLTQLKSFELSENDFLGKDFDPKVPSYWIRKDHCGFFYLRVV
jgi:hypothetical protein